MYKDDTIRLHHMLDAAHQALQFTQGKTRADLNTDPMLKLALVKLIEIVGEAANQVTDEGRTQAPDIPWADIVGMRNRLIHAYFDINLEILWRTIQFDLPPLIAALEHILGI